MTCRICHAPCCGQATGCLTSCCGCRGSLEHVHLQCVQKWMRLSRNTHCRLCGQAFRHPLLRRHPVPPGPFALLVLLGCLLKAWWNTPPSDPDTHQRIFLP